MRLLVLLACIALLPAVQAASHDITVHARDTECPGDKTFCFVIDGDLGAIEPGDDVTFTLINDGTTEHELVVVPYKDRDRDHGATEEDTALGEIEEIPPGAQDTATFTVPDSGFYLFCGLAGHEAAGMWAEAPVAADNGAPMPLPVILLGIVFAVLLARRT